MGSEPTSDRIARVFRTTEAEPLTAVQIAAHLQQHPDDVERCLRSDRWFPEFGTLRLRTGVTATAWTMHRRTDEPSRFQRRAVGPLR
jgi:hypothetical protein